MKMDIVESDLKQLFMWIKNLDELCKSQQVLIEVQDERVSNIEHDLALVLSVIKNRKNST
jgi:hypothetical protein